MIDNGGPRLRRMAALILESSVYADDGNGAIDIVASFNGLPKAERKESELVGFLGRARLRGTEPASHGIAYRQTEARGTGSPAQCSHKRMNCTTS